MAGETTNLHASIGEQHIHRGVNVVARRAAVTLPANVQYAWPHSSRRLLYVASGGRLRGGLGEKHGLTTFAIANDGRLEFARKYDLATDGKSLFWMGMV